MFAPSPLVPELLARVESVVDDLLLVDRAALSGPDLLELVRGLELQVARLAAVDVANLAEVESRHLAADVHCRDTAALLVDLLRVDPVVARQRVNLAQDLGPRTALSGELLPATLPLVAEALGEGVISAAHARRITEFFDLIPAEVAAECGQTLQQQLVGVAVQTTPANLARFCVQLAARLDPDGREPRDKERHRSFTLSTGADGWSKATGVSVRS